MGNGVFSFFLHLRATVICGRNTLMSKRSTSIWLSEDGKRLLALLAQKLGISQSAVLEILIREKAKREKLK